MKIFIKIITAIFIVVILFNQKVTASEKIKIGLLVPLSGQDSEIGNSIIKSVRLAINTIDNPILEIIPKDTASDPQITFDQAKKLNDLGVKIIIGPVFNKNLIFLNELNDIIFLSLTNKIANNPKNIISAGINAQSQLNTIKKFQEKNNLKKTIILVPKENYRDEIDKAIKQSKIKKKKIYYYDIDPTKLTKQIEKITKYSQRKQNVLDEIKRLENSDDENKDKKIERLEKRDTIGKLGFDSVIISDFDESLKSITTSLLYTDVSPKKISFITLNQWFDKSLLKETTTQPIYFPSINKKNYDKFLSDYKKNFNTYPNQLSFLSYDLIGLVYYLIAQNNFEFDKKIFIKKNTFKGKIGIFEIKENKVNHILNFYKVEGDDFKKIF
tara:strand:+ start:8147 stop:9298 length:1152 start_codon:yes stop_codon:yes gene_type:complete